MLSEWIGSLKRSRHKIDRFRIIVAQPVTININPKNLQSNMTKELYLSLPDHIRCNLFINDLRRHELGILGFSIDVERVKKRLARVIRPKRK
jgi:hypothetical protein